MLQRFDILAARRLLGHHPLRPKRHRGEIAAGGCALFARSRPKIRTPLPLPPTPVPRWCPEQVDSGPLLSAPVAVRVARPYVAEVVLQLGVIVHWYVVVGLPRVGARAGRERVVDGRVANPARGARRAVAPERLGLCPVPARAAPTLWSVGHGFPPNKKAPASARANALHLSHTTLGA